MGKTSRINEIKMSWIEEEKQVIRDWAAQTGLTIEQVLALYCDMFCAGCGIGIPLFRLCYWRRGELYCCRRCANGVKVVELFPNKRMR